MTMPDSLAPEKVIVVTTTTAGKDQALQIARSLVESRLAACAQISGPISSVYRWQGEVQSAEEWLCTAKTTAALYSQVEKAIRELHSYQQPEILACDVKAGDEGYIRWVQEEVQRS